MNEGDVRISKMLAYWLRHRPDAAGLTLDSGGWADVDGVLQAFEGVQIGCNWQALLRIVDNNDKKRFEFSADASKIRARQGHSITVELNWPKMEPPIQLFHGTPERLIEPILREGLKAMGRHHVHLCSDVETARRVGARRGRPVVFVIEAAEMGGQGHEFFLTTNGVWLTSHVPPSFLSRLEEPC